MAVTNKGAESSTQSHALAAIKAVADEHDSLDDAVRQYVELAYRNDHLNYVAVANHYQRCSRKPSYAFPAVHLNIFWDFKNSKFTNTGKYGSTIWIARINLRRIRDKRWIDGMLTGDRVKMREAVIDTVKRQVAQKAKGLIKLHDAHSKDAYRMFLNSECPFEGYVLEEWFFANVDEIRFWMEHDDNACKLAQLLGLDK